MTRTTTALVAVLLLAVPALAEETVPATVQEGSRKVKEGGKTIGEGFRAVGRGIKKMFTGERSKEEFKEGKKIGEGFKDLGAGTAGVGRGVGREIKEGFRDDDRPAADP